MPPEYQIVMVGDQEIQFPADMSREEIAKILTENPPPGTEQGGSTSPPAAEPPPPEGGLGMLGAITSSGLRGALMNFADAVGGGLLGASVGETAMRTGDPELAAQAPEIVREAAGAIRGQEQAAAREFPITSTLSELGGALTGLPGLGGVAAGAGRSLGRAIPRMAGMGAAEGAISAYGAQDEQGQGPDIQTSALLGGGLGMLAPAGANIARKVARKFIAPGHRLNKYGRELGEYIEREGVTPEEFVQPLAENPNLVAADLGPGTRQLLGQAGAMNKKVAAQVRGLVERRRAGQAERLEGAIAEEMGPANSRQALYDMWRQTREEVRPAYEAIHEMSFVPKAHTSAMLNDPDMKKALKIAQDIARREGNPFKYKPKAKPPTSSIDIERVKELGKTKNLKEAGYINPDGSLVDMSGGQANTRRLDHREVGGDAGVAQYKAAGNIRVDQDYGFIDLSKKPTESQYRQLAKMIQQNRTSPNQSRGNISVDMTHGLDDSGAFRRVYGLDDSASKIVSDIRNFYQNAPVPRAPMTGKIADYIQQGLRELSEQGAQVMPDGSLRKTTSGNSFETMRQRFLDDIDSELPGFRETRQKWAQANAATEAEDIGRKFHNLSESKIFERWNAMSPLEKEFAKRGYMTQLTDKIRTPQEGANLSTRFNTPKNQAVMNMMIGERGANKFFRQLDTEAIYEEMGREFGKKAVVEDVGKVPLRAIGSPTGAVFRVGQAGVGPLAEGILRRRGAAMGAQLVGRNTNDILRTIKRADPKLRNWEAALVGPAAQVYE